ncbi:TRAP transporter substrate-binding protein DctP [Chloroflexota bacterium]
MKSGIKIMLAVVIASFLVSSLLLGACVKEVPVPGPAGPAGEKGAPGEAAPAPVEKAEQMVLKWSHNAAPDSSHVALNHAPWAHELETITDGRVVVEFYHKGALMATSDTWVGLQLGVCDITFFAAVLAPKALPLYGVPGLPGYPWPLSDESLSAIQWQLLQEFPEMQEELSMIKPLFAFCGRNWLLSKEKIETIDDLKGMRISTHAPHMTEFLTNVGAVPTSVAHADVVVAATQDIIDASGHNWNQLMQWQSGTVYAYSYTVDVGSSPRGWAMNLETWLTIPKDLRAKIEESDLIGYDASRHHSRYMFDILEDLLQMEIEEGNLLPHEVIPPSEEDLISFAEIGAKPIVDRVIAELEAQGKPAQAIHDRTVELCNEWKAADPEPIELLWEPHPDYPFPEWAAGWPIR